MQVHFSRILGSMLACITFSEESVALEEVKNSGVETISSITLMSYLLKKNMKEQVA